MQILLPTGALKVCLVADYALKMGVVWLPNSS